MRGRGDSCWTAARVRPAARPVWTPVLTTPSIFPPPATRRRSRPRRWSSPPAWVRCAGPRDVNPLPYCSAVCCLASLKQATYVKEQIPDAEVTMYYIDRRAPGRNEDVLTKVAATEGVKLVKGKVGKIEECAGGLKLRT